MCRLPMWPLIFFFRGLVAHFVMIKVEQKAATDDKVIIVKWNPRTHDGATSP